MLTPKDPLPEIAAYRQAATHATLVGLNDKAFCCYLAADEATNFYNQTIFFKSSKIFSIQDLAPLGKIHQAIKILTLKKNYNPQSLFSWMFLSNERIDEPLEHYRYWIALSLENSSSRLAEEKKTVIKVLENSPHGSTFLQEVLPYFKTVELLEKANEKKDPLETAILFHRARTLTFTAFYLALLKSQWPLIQKENQTKTLPFFSKMVHCLEQELVLRQRILEATQQGKEKEVRYLTLLVTSWSSIKNCYQQAASEIRKNSESAQHSAQGIQSKEQGAEEPLTRFSLFKWIRFCKDLNRFLKHSYSWCQTARYGEAVTRKSQRLVETILTTPNQRAANFSEHAFFLLKSALDFRMQMKGASPILHQEFASWLKKASFLTKLASSLWIRATHSVLTFPSCSMLIRLWKAAALYNEYEARCKIQQIVVCNKIQQAKYAFKKPLEEKKEYRKKITQALLAQQYELAQQWRLAAAEAHFFFSSSKRNGIASLSEQEWKRFLEQFTSSKTFLLFLYQVSAQEKRELTQKNINAAEIIAHSRYWMVRTAAEKNRNSFQEKNWPEQLLLLHRTYKVACASKHLAYLNSQANQSLSRQASFQAAAACVQKVVSFRTKALEATQTQQEEEAQQWTLAAYTMEQVAEGHIQFSEMIWWKPLAELAQQATAYRLKGIEKRFAGHSRRASYFEKAAFLLENYFDHELELRTSASDQETQETLPAWKKVFEHAKAAAALWGACGTTRSPWKHYFLKRKARQEEKGMRKKIINTLLKKISFCLPVEAFPDAAYHEAERKGKLIPRLEFTIPHAWIYQTWQLLQNTGIHYPLSTQLLEQGITVAWGCYVMNSLGTKHPFSEDFFLVDTIADQLPHPSAHLYLTQNRKYAKYVPHSLFMPHWPQRNLIPRNLKRGDRFENVAFFGNLENFEQELQSEVWKQRLSKELGITFFVQGNVGWHDYSAIDAVVAIRSFSKKRYFYKPATKLYNAWLAGVPFIGGKESAYAAEGIPGKDYLVATSLEEVFQHLKHLKEDISFRHQLVENGRSLGAAFTQEATLEHWKELLQTTLPAYAAKWQEKSVLQRRWFFLVNRLLYCLNFYLQA